MADDRFRWHHEVEDVDTIKGMMAISTSLYPDKAAYKVKEKKGAPYKEITYAQFKEDVDGLGTYLVESGLQGKKIGIIGANCYEWVVAYFAVICGVGVVVPLDKELSSEEIANLSERAGLSAVFYTGKYDKAFEGLDIERKFNMSVYEDSANADVPGHILNAVKEGRRMVSEGVTSYTGIEVDPGALAALLFTSGTTGIPKGVMLSNRNITFASLAASRCVHLKDDDVTLSVLPIHHTFECTMDILTVYSQGACVAFCEGLKYVQKNMAEAGVSILVAVPLIVESLYTKIMKQVKKQKKERALKALIVLNRNLMALGIDRRRSLFRSIYKNFGGKLRLFIVGAASLDPVAMRGLMDLGFDIAQGYGLTETAPLISGTPEKLRHDIYIKAGSCGPEVPYGKITVEDPDEDGIGEFAYEGPNVMLGYYEMPEETAKVIRNGKFYTGDLGFKDEEGWVYITGRSKNVIVTKTGKNIYPEELEVLVNSLPIVTDCMVYGKEEEDGRDMIVAAQILPDEEYIRENISENMTEEEMFDMFKEEVHKINMTLPDYKRIRNIMLRKEDFIRTTTKKIKRQENL